MGFGPDSYHWRLWFSGAGAVVRSPRQQLSKGKRRTHMGRLCAMGMGFRCGVGNGVGVQLLRRLSPRMPLYLEDGIRITGEGEEL